MVGNKLPTITEVDSQNNSTPVHWNLCSSKAKWFEKTMKTIEVTAWVPVRKLIRFNQSMPDDFYECLEGLLSGLPFALKQLSESITAVDVKLASPKGKIAKDLVLLNQDAPTKQVFYEYLKIRSYLRYDKKALEAQNPTYSFSDENISGIAACEFSSLVEDALVLAQLAYPARISTETGRSWVGTHPSNTISRVTGFGYDLLLPVEPFWPSMAVMPLEEVCEWESRVGLFRQGVARTPLQRALASFTHAATLSVTRDGESLFWVMQGLEAFYCRGVGDLRRQMSEKSRIFLGPWEDKKNIVGHLYDFRSKFVHGSFNLDRWNNGQEPDEQDQAESAAFYSSLMLARKMLIATLQKCAKDNIVSVEFNYTLNIEYG